MLHLKTFCGRVSFYSNKTVPERARPGGAAMGTSGGAASGANRDSVIICAKKGRISQLIL